MWEFFKKQIMWLYLFLNAFALSVKLGVQAAPVSQLLAFICSYIFFSCRQQNYAYPFSQLKFLTFVSHVRWKCYWTAVASTFSLSCISNISIVYTLSRAMLKCICAACKLHLMLFLTAYPYDNILVNSLYLKEQELPLNSQRVFILKSCKS